MEICVLGRFEIVADAGERLRVTRPLGRGALLALVLQRNESLPAERLIDLLWAEASETDRFPSLRSCLWSLRKVVPPGRLLTDDVGYRLVIEAGRDRVDLDRFRALHREGRAAADTGDQQAAARALEAATRTWTSEHLADLLPSTSAMASLVTGLLGELRDARNALVHARLALGRHRELVPELRTLLTSDPLNEQLWAVLMAALYRCRLKADALHAFTEARDALATHAGVMPGPELQALYRRVKADDPALRLRPAVRLPTPCGAGEEAVPRQLPADLIDFTGRTGEAAELVGLLSAAADAAAVPVVEVIGPPGVGKTALAVHVAHAVAHAYPDGQLYMRLGGASPTPPTPHAVLGEVLRTLGMAGTAIPQTTHGRAAAYRSRLAGRRVLLVLDDAASARQVRPLLPGTAGGAVITTSRARLPGLPTGRPVSLAPLPHEEARQLLARIVGAARIGTEAAAADQVIDACGRFPLAVRIAGERLGARPRRPIAHLAQALQDERRRLDELTAGDLDVRPSLAAAYQALAPHAQRGLRLLALCGAHDIPAWVGDVVLGEGAAGVLETLADHCLVDMVGVDGAGQLRYRFHDLVREYATELLHADPEARAAQERLARGWLELTALADRGIPRGLFAPSGSGRRTSPGIVDPRITAYVAAHPLVWFDAEHASLLHLIHGSCRAGTYRLAHQLARRIAAYLHLRGCHEEAERMWMAVGQTAEKAGDVAFAARASLRAAIVVAADRGHHARALPILHRCITAFEETGDRRRLARAYGVRAYCSLTRGHPAPGRTDAEAGLQLAREGGDPHTELFCLRLRGAALSRLGHHADAIGCCEQARALADELDIDVYRRVALYSLIKALRRAGRHQRVVQLCEQNLAKPREFAAFFHQQRGLALQHLRRHEKAIAALSDAAAQFRAHHDDYEAACCLRALADSYHATRRHHETIRHLRESIGIFHTLGSVERENEAASTLAAYDPIR